MRTGSGVMPQARASLNVSRSASLRRWRATGSGKFTEVGEYDVLTGECSA